MELFMSQFTKKKSPRAPSISLEDALNKALTVYDKDRRNPTSTDIIAQHLGYKGANNGAALAVLASLKYYGLLERDSNGKLAVSKDVESYKYAPSDQIKAAQVTTWLKTPPIFMELLNKYQEGLPSDATLKFDLIQMGFSPDAANVCLQAFVRSVNYAQPMLDSIASIESNSDVAPQNIDNSIAVEEPALQPNPTPDSNQVPSLNRMPPNGVVGQSEEIDRIPVRLSGGRRAWIGIPIPFYKSDKERLKAQIDLLITDDLDE